MKTVIILAVLVAVALAAPADPQDVTVVKFENDNGLEGYNWSYELSDGSARQETAELKNPGTDDESISVRGSYTYVGDDGITYTVTYVADENGFQPEGAHIPHI